MVAKSWQTTTLAMALSAVLAVLGACNGAPRRSDQVGQARPIDQYSNGDAPAPGYEHKAGVDPWRHDPWSDWGHPHSDMTPR